MSQRSSIWQIVARPPVPVTVVGSGASLRLTFRGRTFRAGAGVAGCRVRRVRRQLPKSGHLPAGFDDLASDSSQRDRGAESCGAYDGAVIINVQSGEPAEPGPEPEPQWSQPPFAQNEQPAPRPPALPAPYPVLQGAVVLPGSNVKPPTPAESALRLIARVLPMLLIFGAIFGPVPWWVAIVGIIVGGSALSQVARDMKRRRVAAAQEQRVLPPTDEDLR